MYPVDGGGESTNEAALGVFILWFCWYVTSTCVVHLMQELLRAYVCDKYTYNG